MSKRTMAGVKVRLYSAAGLGKIGRDSGAGQVAAAVSPKKPNGMSGRKLARRLCGADCRNCRICEYGREWLRRQENGETQ